MKLVTTDNLIPGMVVARDIYSSDDKLILPKNTVLSEKMIARLEYYSIAGIIIEDDKEPPKKAKDNTYSQKIKSSPEFIAFQDDFLANVSSLKYYINSFVEKNEPIDTTLILEETLELIEKHKDINLFDMLHNMRQYDDLTYTHSLNVALICYMFGQWLNFSEEDIHTLILCGLLHDVGKLMIPEFIITKPAKLTDDEFSIIKTHPVRGYEILKSRTDNFHITKAALMHHERYDGTGYPLGLSGNDISHFAKIVAIADVYDAMTSARVYRGPLCPFLVIEIFEKEGLQKYDPKYILTFLERIVQTYINNDVLLSNGDVATVVMTNPTSLAKPIVKKDDIFIDLSAHPDISIKTIL